ncbi:cell wall protein DAN4 [Lingula anatina]|uniref:Cell wall protein DAN4 n=1 Tax=Lingula anatina TaxID=7574 RepID=A0A1S3K8N9_LINAN|nr:cell wall protein DAN4 [Lingula anatina]|eukprot:XP_013418616.1 cell wall protein DAN4 [Lingula anatina]
MVGSALQFNYVSCDAAEYNDTDCQTDTTCLSGITTFSLAVPDEPEAAVIHQRVSGCWDGEVTNSQEFPVGCWDIDNNFGPFQSTIEMFAGMGLLATFGGHVCACTGDFCNDPVSTTPALTATTTTPTSTPSTTPTTTPTATSESSTTTMQTTKTSTRLTTPTPTSTPSTTPSTTPTTTTTTTPTTTSKPSTSTRLTTTTLTATPTATPNATTTTPSSATQPGNNSVATGNGDRGTSTGFDPTLSTAVPRAVVDAGGNNAPSYLVSVWFTLFVAIGSLLGQALLVV